MAPEWAKSHSSLAIVLGRSGETEAAIQECKTAIAIDGKSLPEAYYNLASFCMDSGQISQAVKALEEYLSFFPNGHEAASIRQSLPDLKRELEKVATVTNNSDNYLSARLSEKDGELKWHSSSMPIKFYIANEAGVKGFKPEFVDAAKKAFEMWQEASEGSVSFRFVDRPSDADINLKWVGSSAALKCPAEGGEANGMGYKGIIKGMTIVISTTCLERENDESTIAYVCLHEVGHALGLGHSPQVGDIMYCSIPNSCANIELSKRDRKTVQMLYHQ